MRRFVLFAFLMITFGFSQSLMAECYLTVENSGNLDTKAITQISMVQISQHFEAVNEIPPQGIGTDACVYTLAVSEISNGILVTIKGRNASTYGDSKLRGFDGFQHALFRAIISAKPEQKDPICQRYAGIMGTDCGNVAAPVPAPAQVKGTLIVRVPHDYRYAQILSSGMLIGEMAGEIVREFEVETGVTLVLKAVDGIYQSAELYTSVQPNTPARVEFKGFKSTQMVQPTPAPAPTATPAPAPRYDEKDEPDFGEDGAVVVGFSLNTFAHANKEKDFWVNKIEGDPTGAGFDAFIDVFFTSNLGVGIKLLSVSVAAEGPSGETGDVNSTSFLFTGTIWFPLSTRNKGYSHFGLQGGAGSAVYTATLKTPAGVEWTKMEAEGSASMYGAFFDWGGEVFGARLGYMSYTTELDKSRLTLYEGNTVEGPAVFDADMSGSGFYLTLRWAL